MRRTLLAVTVCLTVLAWLLTWSEAQNMGFLMRAGVPMSLGMAGSAGILSFLVFTGMWLVMMVAMMLPSSYPTLLLHRTIYLKRSPHAVGGTFLFALSYFLVWTATGAFFYSAYVFIGMLRGSIPGIDSYILRASGLALIASGAYQWSWLKKACLKHCQSPLHFILEHWHDGRSGALRMGATHGVYCFGCCWGLMVVLFVMGTMHLGWMAAVGALILLEKVAARGEWISQLMGASFIAMGLIVAVFPSALSYLSSHVLL